MTQYFLGWKKKTIIFTEGKDKIKQTNICLLSYYCSQKRQLTEAFSIFFKKAQLCDTHQLQDK